MGLPLFLCLFDGYRYFYIHCLTGGEEKCDFEEVESAYPARLEQWSQSSEVGVVYLYVEELAQTMALRLPR